MFPTLLTLAAAGAADHYLDRSEVVLDTSSWTGLSDARLNGSFLARDGTVLKVGPLTILKGGNNPDNARSVLWFATDEKGWRIRPERCRLIVEGPPGSGVQKVQFTGDVWVPAVSRRPAGPGWLKDE